LLNPLHRKQNVAQKIETNQQKAVFLASRPWSIRVREPAVP
jgi:hypothetical protein